MAIYSKNINSVLLKYFREGGLYEQVKKHVDEGIEKAKLVGSGSYPEPPSFQDALVWAKP
jgi:hypothetical protein